MHQQKREALERRKSYDLNPLVCKYCGDPLPYEKRMNKFCSRSCSASFSNNQKMLDGWKMSDTTKEKIRSSLALTRKENPTIIPSPNKGRRLTNWVTKKCPECGGTFECTEKSQKKYCSEPCWKKNRGGFREKSGRSKSGHYKGIYCNSTYELVWVIYRLDHNLPVQRFQSYITFDGNRKYYPDFVDGNKIYEMKGWNTEKTNPVLVSKCKAAIDSGYEIQVLFKEDLTREFDWVKQHYKCSSLEELYDNHIPQYTYVCKRCGVEFTRTKKARTEAKICSRYCTKRH